MKILITGSEGYIASNLKDYLKGKNIEIIDTLKKVIPDETSDVDVTIEE